MASWAAAFTLIGAVLAFAVAAPSYAQSSSPARLSLAMVLPHDLLATNPFHHVQSDFFTGSMGDRSAYNAQLMATGALVFADDAGIYKSLQGPKPSESLTGLAHDFNHLGDPVYVAPALGLVYLAGGTGNRRLAWQAGLAVIKAGIIGEIAKEMVGRARPVGRDGGQDDRFKPFSLSSDNYQSFPSGHSLVAFSLAAVWAQDRPRQQYLAYGLATTVGLARIYTHAHWPSDVFWGAVLGISQGRQVVHGNTNLFTIRF